MVLERSWRHKRTFRVSVQKGLVKRERIEKKGVVLGEVGILLDCVRWETMGVKAKDSALCDFFQQAFQLMRTSGKYWKGLRIRDELS